jgi:hypothetical protein
MDALQQVRLSALLQSFKGRAVEDGQTATGPSLRVGAEVLARVAAVLVDGRAVLDVEGGVYQTRLPPGLNAGVGSSLPLVVLKGGANPTFGLSQQTITAQPAEAGSARVALSSLSGQLQSISAAAARESASPLPQVPLVDAPPTDGVALEAPLRKALEGSGLFYESHQAEWIGGRRDLASLRQEPQARLAESAVRSAEEPSASDVAQPSNTSPSTLPEAGSTAASRDAGASGALPQGIATLVDRQLQSLGTQQIHWSGQVWPGQNMEWVVEEDAPESREPGDAPSWTSRLRLDLPRVGAVEAVLRLRGAELQVELVAADAARAEMGAATAQLRDSLAARGLSLAGMRLRGEDEDV